MIGNEPQLGTALAQRLIPEVRLQLELERLESARGNRQHLIAHRIGLKPQVLAGGVE